MTNKKSDNDVLKNVIIPDANYNLSTAKSLSEKIKFLLGEEDVDKKSDNFYFKLNNGTSKINTDILNLEVKLQKYIEETDDANKESRSLAELKNTINELKNKYDIKFLLDCVTEKAHNLINNNEKFKENFFSEYEQKSFVLSLDIRRSTELMLKARSPKLFSDFMSNFCNEVVEIFKKNFAVVDKFTGDGILAFFPEFFSGNDAGYYAIKAATEANNTFERLYKKFRTSFSTVLRDVGLGTGIDYGNVHLVRMAGSLTIVGQPVVYACRLGGAPARKIYINQPAYEIINEKYPNCMLIKETSIEIKSEGALICYDVELSNKAYTPSIPEWCNQ